MKIKTILLMIALSLGSANFVNANDDTCQVATALKINFFQEKVKQGQKRLETLRSKKANSEELLYSFMERSTWRSFSKDHINTKINEMGLVVQKYKEKIAETEKELLSSSITETNKCSSIETTYLASFHEIKSKYIQKEIRYKRRELSRLRIEQANSEEQLPSAINSSQKHWLNQNMGISYKRVVNVIESTLERHKEEIAETEKDLQSLVLALETL